MHKKTLFKLAAVLAFAFLWMALQAPAPTFAATITVDTTADEFGTPGTCSLREAIQSANTDTAVGGCVAGSGDDVINLPAGTYSLTRTGADDTNVNGDLDISSNITIVGVGAGQTIIDATGLGDRVLHILSGNVTLQNLTVTGGSVNNANGGGILQADGSLTIESSVISANTASGTSGNGGGVARTAGTLSIVNSTIQGNQAESRGGGLYTITSTGGDTTIIASTFANNIVIGGGGGAVFVGTGPSPTTSAQATLTNVTMTGNSVSAGTGGGAIWVRDNGILVLANGTLHGNTSNTGAQAIRQQNSGSITLDNVIISGTGTLCVGTISSNDLRASDGTCGIAANPVTNFDTTLRDNGGPTLTHALLPGSNAIDAGNNATCATTDQRGFSRPVDYDLNGTPTCDIGAFERQAAETFTATVNDGDTVAFGATLTTILDNNSGTSPEGVTVTRINQPPGGGTPGAGEMPFHVNITADVSTGLDINLTLCYTDWELTHNTTGVVEANLTLYRWDGSAWVDQGMDTLDTTINCATKNNVSTLSSWTLASGPPAPTAVSLQSFSANNTVVSALAFGSLLVLLGGSSLTLLRRRQNRA